MENRACIAAEDGVVHYGHNYVPEDIEGEYFCTGIYPYYRDDVLEQRLTTEYALAMYVTIDGVRILHKTGKVQTPEEAEKILKELEEDFRPGLWFIVKDTIEVNSYAFKD